MDSFSYSNKIYKLHFNQYSQISNCKDKVMLEMGGKEIVLLPQYLDIRADLKKFI